LERVIPQPEKAMDNHLSNKADPEMAEKQLGASLRAFVARMAEHLNLTPEEFSAKAVKILGPHFPPSTVSPFGGPLKLKRTDFDTIISHAEQKMEIFFSMGDQMPQVEFVGPDSVLVFTIDCPDLHIENETLRLEKSEFRDSFRVYRRFIKQFNKNQDYVSNYLIAHFVKAALNYPLFHYIHQHSPSCQASIDHLFADLGSTDLLLSLLGQHFDVEKIVRKFWEVSLTWEGGRGTHNEFLAVAVRLWLSENREFFATLVQLDFYLRVKGGNY
jgi:hypothetical protein